MRLALARRRVAFLVLSTEAGVSNMEVYNTTHDTWLLRGRLIVRIYSRLVIVYLCLLYDT